MRLAWLALTAALAGAGCERAPEWPPQPAAIVLGEDACAGCRMIVSDGRFAVQVQSRDGKVEFFDDLGCLAERAREVRPEVAGIFVREMATGAWVRGDAAHLARVPGLATPMGSGLAAFATEAAARAEAARHENAKVLPLEKLVRGES